MNRFIARSAIGMAITACLWAFVGVERIVGDHEVGVYWEPFIKHRPSSKIHFENPAQKGLDLTPIEELSDSERPAFAEFCELRFGEVDAKRCYARIADRRI